MLTHAITSLRKSSRCFRGRNGQSLVEYALVLSFISVVIVAVMSVLGVEIRGIYMTSITVIHAALANAGW